MEGRIGYDRAEFRFCSSELTKKNMISVKLLDDFDYDQAAKTFDNERKAGSVHAADGGAGTQRDAVEEAARRPEEARAGARAAREAPQDRVPRWRYSALTRREPQQKERNPRPLLLSHAAQPPPLQGQPHRPENHHPQNTRLLPGTLPPPRPPAQTTLRAVQPCAQSSPASHSATRWPSTPSKTCCSTPDPAPTGLPSPSSLRRAT